MKNTGSATVCLVCALPITAREKGIRREQFAELIGEKLVLYQSGGGQQRGYTEGHRWIPFFLCRMRWGFPPVSFWKKTESTQNFRREIQTVP